MIHDEALVGHIQSGDTQAFEQLVKRYRALAYFIITRTIGDSPEAEDILQEVFIGTFKTIGTFNPAKASFKTWLLSIVKRRCVDFLRKSGGKLATEDISAIKERPDTGNGPEEAFALLELHEELKRGLLTLSEEQRFCLVLKSIESLSYDEIAGIMEIPVGTVKSRISTARRNLLKQVSGLLDSVEEGVGV